LEQEAQHQIQPVLLAQMVVFHLLIQLHLPVVVEVFKQLLLE
jgi:hypothetical protein